MISIQQPYVEYIKIPTTDANGLDLTPTLLALTQIKIPFSNGVSVTYFIESTTNFSSYFLFGIVKASNSPFQSDGGNLNYDYTSSLSQTAVSGIKIPPNGVNNPIPLTGVPTDIFGIDNTNLIFQTYTQKDVTIGVSFTASISGGPLEAKLLKNGFAISGVSGVALNVGTTKGIISATFTSSSLSPGDNFQFNMQAPTAGGAYEFTGSLLGKSHFFASSNLASGSYFETIPEPFLTSNFEGSDCDILLNNVDIYRENPFLQDIDYSSNPNTPVNFNALLSGSAVLGTVPESYYTSQKHAGPRYNGVKNQTTDVNFYKSNSPSFNNDDPYINPLPVVGGTPGANTFLPLNGIFPPFIRGKRLPVPLSPGFITGSVSSDNKDLFQTVKGTQEAFFAGGGTYNFNGIIVNDKMLRDLEKAYQNLRIQVTITGSIFQNNNGNATKVEIPVYSYSSIIGGIYQLLDVAFYQRGVSVYQDTSGNFININNGNNIVNFTGTIPTSAITANRNLLALSISSTFNKDIDATELDFTDVFISLSLVGVPQNIGTYGQSPSIDQLDVNIYEYEWGGGTTPEILDWGAVRLGKILQASSPDLVKVINPSSDVEVRIEPQKANNDSNGSTTARGFRQVINKVTGQASYPDNSLSGSIPTSSVYDPTFTPTGSSTQNFRSFWLGPKKVSEYSETLNTNNKINSEISFFPYPNQANAGSNPTIPTTTKILTTEFGVPGISNYGLTSSYGNFNLNTSPPYERYGFIIEGSPYITLYRDAHISKLKRDSNGLYTSSTALKPNWSSIGNQINTDLNDGERWFATLYNELEWPNGTGDFNTPLTTGSLSPFNQGYTTEDDRGNLLYPFQYKGVWEILGTRDSFNQEFYLLCDEKFYIPSRIPSGSTAGMNIGGNVPGNSLGMLLWKARASNLTDFVMVQDSVTGGVGAGAFTSKFVPDYISENLNNITSEYGTNNPS